MLTARLQRRATVQQQARDGRIALKAGHHERRPALLVAHLDAEAELGRRARADAGALPRLVSRALAARSHVLGHLVRVAD